MLVHKLKSDIKHIERTKKKLKMPVQFSKSEDNNDGTSNNYFQSI